MSEEKKVPLSEEKKAPLSPNMHGSGGGDTVCVQILDEEDEKQKFKQKFRSDPGSFKPQKLDYLAKSLEGAGHNSSTLHHPVTSFEGVRDDQPGNEFEGVLNRLVGALSPYRFIDWRTTWFLDADMEAMYVDYFQRKHYPWLKWKLLAALILYLCYCGLQGDGAFERPALIVALIDVSLTCSLAWIPAERPTDQAFVRELRRFWQRYWRMTLFVCVIVYFLCLQFSLHSQFDQAMRTQDFCTCSTEPCVEDVLLNHCHQLEMWSRAFQLSIWLMLLVVFVEEIPFLASIGLSLTLLLILVVGMLSMSSEDIEAEHRSTVCLRSSLAVCGFLGIILNSRYNLEITARVAFQHEVLHPRKPMHSRPCTHAHALTSMHSRPCTRVHALASSRNYAPHTLTMHLLRPPLSYANVSRVSKSNGSRRESASTRRRSVRQMRRSVS
jgi:hypothetical protein